MNNCMLKLGVCAAEEKEYLCTKGQLDRITLTLLKSSQDTHATTCTQAGVY